MKPSGSALFLPAVLLAAACSPGEPVAQPSGQAAGIEAPAPTQSGDIPFNTRATIRDVMNTLIDPHADTIWSAVRIVVNEQGVQEFAPESEEEWQALRRSAVAMIEGGNALMIPGRQVAPEGAGTVYPDYEYLPAEVAEKLAEDWDSWVGFAQSLQEAGMPVLDAIEARDPDALIEAGAAIDAACEACHVRYWYRPVGEHPGN